jgi:hypothetical protein
MIEIESGDLPIPGILLHSFDLLLRDKEGLLKCIKHLLAWWVLFAEVVIAKLLLHMVFDMKGQPVLQQTTHFATILSVSVTNREELAVLQTHYMRGSDVRILIHFVRIMSCDTSLGRK